MAASTPIDVGDVAPDVVCPGLSGTSGRLLRLSRVVEDAVSVLAFCPFDALDRVEFVDWLQFLEGVATLVVTDRPYGACRRAPAALDAAVPLLCDGDGSVARTYGVRYETGPAAQAVFLLDRDRTVRRRWTVPRGFTPTAVFEAAQDLTARQPTPIPHGP